MSWFAAIPTLLAAIAFLVLPGAPIAWSVGARGITFVAISIGSSVSAISLASIIAPVIGIPWQLYTPFLVSLPISVLGFILRRWWLHSFSAPRLPGEWRGVLATALAASAIGGALIGRLVKAGIGMPDWVAQTPDVSFHLNAVRQILDTGNASMFALNLAYPQSPVVSYPDAWHAITSLVVQLSGAEIVVAANITTIAISSMIWPVACVFLARVIFGTQKLPLLLTGLLAAAFADFPLRMTGYGVLYPYLLSVALMPIALGLIVMATGRARAGDMEPPGRWLLVLWVLVGVAISHPSSALAVLALAVPLVLQVLIEYLAKLNRRPQHSRQTWTGGLTVSVFVVLGLVGFAYVWLKVGAQPGTNPTKPSQTASQAVGEVLLNAALQRPAAIAVSALMMVGILVVLRQKNNYWIIGSWLVSVGFFVAVAGLMAGPLRSATVGIWYNNSPRLAALLPLLALTLAVTGSVFLIRWLQRWINSTSAFSRRANISSVSAVTPLFALLVLALLTQSSSSLARGTEIVANTYRLSADSALLNPDELTIFDEVKKLTPESAVIAGNPWTGAALVYAFTGRQALFPHLRGTYNHESWSIAADASPNPQEICPDILVNNVTHLLDFGDRYITPTNASAQRYPAFDEIRDGPGLELLAQRGEAKLYKITACGLD